MKKILESNLVPLFLECLCVLLFVLGFFLTIPLVGIGIIAGIALGVFLVEKWISSLPSPLGVTNRLAFYPLFGLVGIHLVLTLLFPAQSDWWNWWVIVSLLLLLAVKGVVFSSDESMGRVESVKKNQALVRYYFDPKSGLAGGTVLLPIPKGKKIMVGKKVSLRVSKGIIASHPTAII